MLNLLILVILPGILTLTIVRDKCQPSMDWNDILNYLDLLLIHYNPPLRYRRINKNYNDQHLPLYHMNVSISDHYLFIHPCLFPPIIIYRKKRCTKGTFLTINITFFANIINENGINNSKIRQIFNVGCKD